MFNLFLKLPLIQGLVSSISGDPRIEWQDQYCENWEDISSMVWPLFRTVSCTKIWPRLTSNDWENETTNYESLG